MAFTIQTRPFSSKEECWNKMKKHQPFGWIKDADCYYNVTVVDNEGIYVNDYEDDAIDYTFNHAHSLFKFADGEPFGIMEGQGVEDEENSL